MFQRVGMPSSRAPFQAQDLTCVSCIGKRVLYHYHHLGGGSSKNKPYWLSNPNFFLVQDPWTWEPDMRLGTLLPAGEPLQCGFSPICGSAAPATPTPGDVRFNCITTLPLLPSWPRFLPPL